MLQTVLKAQLILFIMLVALNSVVIISVKHERNKSAEVVEVSAPDGMKYMEYCQGGASKTLTEENDTSCIAEYPGDFAVFVITFYSLVLFIVFPVLYMLTLKIVTYIRNKKELH